MNLSNHPIHIKLVTNIINLSQPVYIFFLRFMFHCLRKWLLALPINCQPKLRLCCLSIELKLYKNHSVCTKVHYVYCIYHKNQLHMRTCTIKCPLCTNIFQKRSLLCPTTIQLRIMFWLPEPAGGVRSCYGVVAKLVSKRNFHFSSKQHVT